MTRLREMDAELMGAPRVREETDVREVPERLDPLELRERRATRRGLARHLLPVPGIASDRGIVDARRFHHAPDNRLIDLFHLARLELLRERFLDLAALRDEQDAGRKAIE